ncbi:MAG: Nucleolar Complex 2 protein, partial [Pleopsidium flavum]
MAGQARKATKKFEKNHLKDTIGRRKELAKIKQRHQVKAKKKAKNASERREENANKSNDAEFVDLNGKEKVNRKGFSEMSVDEFFQGGFDIPEAPQKKGGKVLKSKGVAKKTGKRKRTEENDDKEGSSSDSPVEDNVVSSESELGSEAEDDLDTHKGDLDALAEKDPEFY